ncbi:unnamed protein product [Oppiella nova]|uniref:Fucosyltransferase n=1 Tax=Oppiella nova TaxID=334625 RepID=A0A7R9M172_9ACAR|nr:unnamed protein product [Oppiella nova]CAG2168935.1 unnamed protein product [Oppiella nova]
MLSNSSPLTENESAGRRRGKSGAGVRHRLNCLPTLSSLHSHSSSSVKKNKSLKVGMNTSKPIKTTTKKDNFVIKLGNQQFMQHMTKTGTSSMSVNKDKEESGDQCFTFQQKVKVFFVLLMIPSAVVVFTNNNKFNNDNNSNQLQYDPRTGHPYLPGHFPGAGAFPNGMPGGYGGGFPGNGFPGQRFPGRDGRPNYPDWMRRPDDPGEAMREHLEQMNGRNEENESYDPEDKNLYNNNEEIEKHFMNQMSDTEPHEEPNERKDEKPVNNVENSKKLNEKQIETNAKKEEVQHSSDSGKTAPVKESGNSDVFMKPNDKEMKTIMLWTPIDEPVMEGNQAFIDAKCVINKCIFVTNKLLVDQSDAIVFSARHLPTYKPPNFRSKQQKWIFFSSDSPQYDTQEELNSMSLAFNWSWTYRSDSDIIYNAANVEQMDWESNKSFKDSDIFYDWRKKTKMILSIQHNCHPNREESNYVNQFKSYIDIDIHSKCSDNQNPMDITNQTELKALSEKYLFILVFESYCKDFVSKRLHQYLEHSIIPIVKGGADYSKIVPQNSVINTNDFTSAKDLADYVLDIGTDFQKYKKFFEWKRNHKISYKRKDFCQLCVKLHKRDNSGHHSFQLKEWWFAGTHCKH